MGAWVIEMDRMVRELGNGVYENDLHFSIINGYFYKTSAGI